MVGYRRPWPWPWRAQPHCVMPLIVAEKPSSTATNLKLRLIHDCRYINGFVNKIPFSMERLKDSVKQLRPVSYTHLTLPTKA